MRLNALIALGLAPVLLAGCGPTAFDDAARGLVRADDPKDAAASLRQMAKTGDLEGMVTDAFCAASARSVSEDRPLDAGDVEELALATVERAGLGFSTGEIDGKLEQLEAAGVFASEGNSRLAVRYLQACNAFR